MFEIIKHYFSFFRRGQASGDLLPRGPVRAQRGTHDRRGDWARQAQTGRSGRRRMRSKHSPSGKKSLEQERRGSDFSQFVGRIRPPNPSATPSARNLQGIRLGPERVGQPSPRSAAADSQQKRRTTKATLVIPPVLVISCFVSFLFVLFSFDFIRFHFNSNKRWRQSFYKIPTNFYFIKDFKNSLKRLKMIFWIVGNG